MLALGFEPRLYGPSNRPLCHLEYASVTCFTVLDIQRVGLITSAGCQGRVSHVSPWASHFAGLGATRW